MSTIKEIYGIYDPKVVKYKDKMPAINPELVIGLELETENCSNVTYNNIAKETNYIVHTDGSLRGVAYEFISKPMTTENALAATKDFWNLCKFTDENYTDRTSLHFHVNCVNLEIEQISSIALLYTVFEEILFEFVGKYRDTNIYCVPWNQCRNHYNLVQNFLSDSTTLLRGWNKYTALNLLPLTRYGTIEFRQMHGTCNYEKFSTWVNIIGAIFKYTSKVPLKDLITTINSLNTVSHYEQFFTEVLSGILPYNDTYRQKLEDGVIFGKYTLMEYGKEKKKKAIEDALKLDDVGAFVAGGVVAGIPPAVIIDRVAYNLNDLGQLVRLEETERQYVDMGVRF